MALDETKPDGSTDYVSSLDTYIKEDRVAINLNTTHRSSDGSDHTFIDQDVTSGATPTFTGTNFSGIPDTALSSGATITSAGAGDSGKLVKLDASGKLDSSVFTASIETTSLAVTGLTVSQLLRVNAGGTAIESSGKTVPTGDIVGTSDTQTLTNKTLTTPVIDDGDAGCTITSADQTNASATITIPDCGDAADTFVLLDTTQTLTGKTLTTPVLSVPVIADFTSATHDHSNAANGGTLGAVALASPVLTTPQINDTSSDHQYIFAVNELTADRTVTLPLLTGGDTFVFQAHTQTLTNKTLTSPTITTMLIDDTDAGVTLTSADQTHATPTVTIPDIVDAADTFCMVDTAQTLTNKTLTTATLGGNTGITNTGGAPGGALTDGVYFYAADIVAGNSAPHFYTEEGEIIKLYQNRSANQAVITPTTTGANTGTSGAGLSLIGDTTAVNQASNIMNDFIALKEDIVALNTLVEAIRTALINVNIIKGSA